MEEEVLGKAYDGRLMRRLLVYMKPYRGTVAVSLVLLLGGSLLQIVGPLITKYAIDTYLTAGKPNPAAFRGLMLLALAYLGAILFAMVLEFAQTYLMQKTGQQAMFDLRRDLIDKLQRLDVSYFDHNPAGRLLTRVTTDVDVLNELFSSGLVTIFGDLFMLTFVLAAMFQLSPGMTAMLLAVLPIVVGVMALFRRTVQKSNRRIRTAVARINSFLQEYVSGMSVVQLFNREQRARQDFDAINYDHMDAYKDAVIAYGWFYPVVEFLSMLSLALLLSWAGFGIQKGAMTIGVLVAFLQYGLRFFRPIQDLSEKYNIMQSAMSAAERIFKLLDTEPAVVSPAAPRSLPEGKLAIEFDHVWFAYKEDDWILRDLTFRIEPGETI
ncbi:MAG: ABC transporter transmembrane domain-containing protein, partial [Bryobacteraceae bacterium]